MKYTIENSKFAELFYNKVKNYAHYLYEETSFSIKDGLNNIFSSTEIMYIIIINKTFFQSMLSFFELVEMNYAIPAFNSLRSAIEAMRLFRVFFQSEDFRKKYLSNSNIDFRNGNDYSFTQSKVIMELNKQEDTLRKQNKVPLSPVLNNHSFTKGSMISEMHSELSRWSHLLNSNMLILPYMSEKRINLDIKDEYTKEMQMFIKKYVELSYFLLEDHLENYVNVKLNKNVTKYQKEMISLYEQYIKLFY